MNDIDFYFDFISPYAYLASRRIEQLAERQGRIVRWHAFRLGVAVVKVMGLKPLMETPLKSTYITRDLERLALVMGEPLTSSLTLPDPIPPARLFYSAPSESSARLAKALLCARWARGLDIGQEDVLAEIAGEIGLDQSAARRALHEPGTREALAAATTAAIDRGVFGSPTCAVGSELFWGTDRLWLLERYLEAGERF